MKDTNQHFMKTAEQWIEEMRAECSNGDPSTSMLDRIKEIQADAIGNCMLSPELVAENDDLRARLARQSEVMQCALKSSAAAWKKMADGLDRAKAEGEMRVELGCEVAATFRLKQSECENALKAS